jgi:hypothetical protein
VLDASCTFDPATLAVSFNGSALPAGSFLPFTACSAGRRTSKPVVVNITLPNGSTTPGVISQISRVASSSSSSSSGSPGGSSSGSGSAGATITVLVSDCRRLPGLNAAPLTVAITTGSVANALTVPVNALLAQWRQLRGGGDRPGGHHLVMSLGCSRTPPCWALTGLAPGQHVVVPGL